MSSVEMEFSYLEDGDLIADPTGVSRVSNVRMSDDNIVRFDVTTLDGEFSESREYDANELVEIVDECKEDLSEEAFLDFLDSVHGEEVQVCGYAMNPGRVLRTMDRIAFDQMHNDWTDMHETECGQH